MTSANVLLSLPAERAEVDTYAIVAAIERLIMAGVQREAVFRSPAHSAMTLAEVCEAFLCRSDQQCHDQQIGPARHQVFLCLVRRDIVPFMGKTLMADLTVGMVHDLYSRLTTDRGICPYVARTRISILRQVEDFAIRRGWAKDSVVPRALQELRGLRRPEQMRFKPDQVRALLQSASGRSERAKALLQLFVHIAAFCGLRYGEIAALAIDDVDLERGSINVRHNLTCADLLKPPKTRAGVRTVPMPSHVGDLIGCWMAAHRLPEPRGLMFRTLSGKPVNSASFHRRMWHPLLVSVDLGGQGYHFHALRGFAASWWIENGIPITTVAKWLGHAKPDMTLEFYARSLNVRTNDQEVSDRLARALLTV